MNKLRRKRTDASVIPEGTGELAETIEGLVGLPGDTGVFLAGVWVAGQPALYRLKAHLPRTSRGESRRRQCLNPWVGYSSSPGRVASHALLQNSSALHRRRACSPGKPVNANGDAQKSQNRDGLEVTNAGQR